MNESKQINKNGSDSILSTVGPNSSWLQLFREGIAGIISLLVLTLAVTMLYRTYNYARETPSNADASEISTRKESYERQKDIMLYALALLGTVTGYYLGRAPAELHAQQAHQSATIAQNNLHKTESTLRDTAASVVAATAQINVAEKERDATRSKLSKAAISLDHARTAIASTLPSGSAARFLGQPAGDSTPNLDVENLKRVKDEIDVLLQVIGDE